jgi:predicted enzyme related to lactoylglutathione lyase
MKGQVRTRGGMNLKHAINWFEIPVLDMGRAKKFYQSILQLELTKMDLGSNKYALFPTEDRYNCGALAQGEFYKPTSNGVTIYLDGGNDLNLILTRVTDAGGQVILDKTFLGPEAGYIGLFIDSEGNRIGLQNM